MPRELHRTGTSCSKGFVTYFQARSYPKDPPPVKPPIYNKEQVTDSHNPTRTLSLDSPLLRCTRTTTTYSRRWTPRPPGSPRTTTGSSPIWSGTLCRATPPTSRRLGSFSDTSQRGSESARCTVQYTYVLSFYSIKYYGTLILYVPSTCTAYYFSRFNHEVWFLYYPEEGNKRGAPVQLFRGVEFGLETKALLFKRLCAYAGLHAEVGDVEKGQKPIRAQNAEPSIIRKD